jgi:chloramphenicol 3-O phosphotransferase
MTRSTILLLNGPGSAGKTTLARHLQNLTEAPFLHMQMDTFLEMQPPRCNNHPDTFHWATVPEADGVRTAFRTGPSGAALMRGFRQSIADMASEGWNIIADDVAVAKDWEDYCRRLSAHQLITVKVFAALDVLEARERARGDRMIGLARDQWQRIHEGIAYDIEIDTGTLTPDAAAQRIAETFKL